MTLSKQYLNCLLKKQFGIYKTDKKKIINNKYIEISQLLALELMKHSNRKITQSELRRFANTKHLLIIGSIFYLNDI